MNSLGPLLRAGVSLIATTILNGASFAQSIDGEWELVSVDGGSPSEAHQTITFGHGRASLKLDCNWYEYRYVITEAEISATPTGNATTMACNRNEEYPAERQMMENALIHSRIEQEGMLMKLYPVDAQVRKLQFKARRPPSFVSNPPRRPA